MSGQAWPHSIALQQEANWFCYQTACHSHESQYNPPGFPESWKGTWFNLKKQNKTLAGSWDTIHCFGAIAIESNPKGEKGMPTGSACSLGNCTVLCKGRVASLGHATQLHLSDGRCPSLCSCPDSCLESLAITNPFWPAFGENVKKREIGIWDTTELQIMLILSGNLFLV